MIKNFIPHGGQALWLVDWSEESPTLRAIEPIVGWRLEDGELYPIAVPHNGRPRLVSSDKISIYTDEAAASADAYPS